MDRKDSENVTLKTLLSDPSKQNMVLDGRIAALERMIERLAKHEGRERKQPATANGPR
jgi:hypothetical protein